MGAYFQTQPEGKPIFGRRTIIIDKTGVIRYVRDGSPDFKDILLFLKKLNQEGGKP
jgi:peroxiredoxin Q/BCP